MPRRNSRSCRCRLRSCSTGWLRRAAKRAAQPGEKVQWLLQALAERPDDTALREVAASALQACSADDEAIDLLWEYVERHTDEEQQLATTCSMPCWPAASTTRSSASAGSTPTACR